MITTLQPLLDDLSDSLKEKTTDTSASRIRLVNRAIRQVMRQARWRFMVKEDSIAVPAEGSVINLVTEITDFNPQWGLYAIGFSDQPPLNYVLWDDRNYHIYSKYFSLTPDNKGLILGQSASSYGDEITVHYYARHANVTTANATLNVPIPEDFTEAIVEFAKGLVHESKRQRADQRNAMLTYKQAIDELRPQEAANKARRGPKTVQFFQLPIRRY